MCYEAIVNIEPGTADADLGEYQPTGKPGNYHQVVTRTGTEPEGRLACFQPHCSYIEQ